MSNKMHSTHQNLRNYLQIPLIDKFPVYQQQNLRLQKRFFDSPLQKQRMINQLLLLLVLPQMVGLTDKWWSASRTIFTKTLIYKINNNCSNPRPNMLQLNDHQVVSKHLLTISQPLLYHKVPLFPRIFEMFLMKSKSLRVSTRRWFFQRICT